VSLWRVDIEGVSTRYVDADTAGQAMDEVTEQLMAAIDIRATPAGSALQRGFDQTGPAQRRRLLDDLDTLTSPRSIRSARAARRRLARQIRFDIQRRAWVMSQLELAQPIDPESADQLLRSVELRLRGATTELPVETEALDRAMEA
jgi:hypothetical protein